jgi:hypothetical protein
MAGRLAGLEQLSAFNFDIEHQPGAWNFGFLRTCQVASQTIGTKSGLVVHTFQPRSEEGCSYDAVLVIACALANYAIYAPYKTTLNF